MAFFFFLEAQLFSRINVDCDRNDKLISFYKYDKLILFYIRAILNKFPLI